MRNSGIQINIPFTRQKTDYFCGPATLQMIFNYHDKNKTQEELAEIMGTKEKVGTKKAKMIDIVKKYGFHFCAKENSEIEEIEELLKNKIPVVVNFIEPSEEISHYAIVTGINKREIIFNDPWNGNGFKMLRQEFLKRWYGFKGEGKRWLLAVCNRPFCNCACGII